MKVIASQHVSDSRHGAAGFTLLELLAAITVVGMLLAVAVPASVKFYESTQYRQSIRDTITLLASARHKAVTSGEAQDVVINPERRSVTFGKEVNRLPKEVQLAVTSAREVNRENEGVIRFYPEGGSSGGGIDIERPGVGGVSIQVDWLVGRVTHEAYDVN
jgi:general secretion pathway protein H